MKAPKRFIGGGVKSRRIEGFEAAACNALNITQSLDCGGRLSSTWDFQERQAQGDQQSTSSLDVLGWTFTKTRCPKVALAKVALAVGKLPPDPRISSKYSNGVDVWA